MKIEVKYYKYTDFQIKAVLTVIDKEDYITDKIFVYKYNHEKDFYLSIDDYDRPNDNPAYYHNYLQVVDTVENIENSVCKIIDNIKERLQKWRSNQIPKSRIYKI